MGIFLIILGVVVFYFTILSTGALSGIFSERVGIVNIAINGMMIIGGVTYVIFSYYITDKGTKDAPGMQFVAMLVAMLVAGVFSMLHALASIKFKADQIISGTAINMLALGLAMMLIKIVADQNSINTTLKEIFFSKDVNNVGSKIGFNFVFTIVMLVGAWFALNKTRWGLRLKAVGENPSAADAAGINVYAKQYQGVAVSGMFAGLGGVFFAQHINAFYGGVNGIGFLSLAVMIMGQWKTYWSGLGALVFAILVGFAEATTIAPDWIPALVKYSELTKAIPFIITLVSMVVFSKTSKAPKAAGVPYNKALR